MVRTDTHRPTAINPDEYEFVAVTFNTSGLESMIHDAVQRKFIREHMQRTGGAYSRHKHGGTCMICGAHANYLATYYHKKTNSYINTGETCAFHMDREVTQAFRDMRKSVTDWNNLKAGKLKAKNKLNEVGLDYSFELYKDWQETIVRARNGEPLDMFYDRERVIIHEIVSKLVKYGNISEKQIAFMRTLENNLKTGNTWAAQQQAREEAWAAENANAAPCPSGRVEIVGTIVKVKEHESNYGTSWKMIVKADNGFRVYGSIPNTIHDANKNDKVKFTATVTPSNDDPKFGFFKRPSKASFINRA